jgi:RNA polymerase sigma-70 factor (ECF subfamily)
VASSGLSSDSALALVNGSPGIVWAPHGRLARALAFTITDGKVSRIDVIADPPRLRHVNLAVLG